MERQQNSGSMRGAFFNGALILRPCRLQDMASRNLNHYDQLIIEMSACFKVRANNKKSDHRR